MTSQTFFVTAAHPNHYWVGGQRDWLAVDDHCAWIEHVLNHGQPDTIYNVGDGNEKENLTVAELIFHCLGKPKSLIRFVTGRPGHDRRYAIDCSRLRGLGWQHRASSQSKVNNLARPHFVRKKVSARGGELYVFGNEDSEIPESQGAHILRLPEQYGEPLPILHVIPS